MELILIRHGKAEPRDAVSSDEKRRLIPKGVEKLKDDLPYLRGYLKNRPDLLLWTSDITRAKETAELVSEICLIKEIDTKEFLGTGEYKEMVKSLKKTPAEATIVMVGHEPDLSFWAEKLCRKTIVFKKGGAAIIELKKEPDIKGQLVQVLKPGDFHRLTNGKKTKKA
ncbi:histidine phosphatase family protein [Eubacteriaceae bacterium ES2]|nr:histidine phosphatase family protein [Eubacteriaceae bacterium ES2]